MPPHVPHAVYSPVFTFAVGGHMLTYESLHLTEKARRADVELGEVATNTDHDSVDGVLCRMAIGLRHGTTKCKIVFV